MKTTEITIQGMSCGHCVQAVKRELAKLSGVTLHDVKIGKASVSYNEAVVTEAMLRQAVEQAGYTVESIS